MGRIWRPVDHLCTALIWDTSWTHTWKSLGELNTSLPNNQQLVASLGFIWLATIPSVEHWDLVLCIQSKIFILFCISFERNCPFASCPESYFTCHFSWTFTVDWHVGPWFDSMPRQFMQRGRYGLVPSGQFRLVIPRAFQSKKKL